MIRRKGASLLNVMVFMMFSVMVTAQVFFFAKNSMDSVAEQREMMMYRMNLDALVEEAKTAIKNTSQIEHNGTINFTFRDFLNFYSGKTRAGDSNGQPWTSSLTSGGTYNVIINDLDYSFNASDFDRDEWIAQNYSNGYAYMKPFAAMSPDVSEPNSVADRGVVVEPVAPNGVDGATSTVNYYSPTLLGAGEPSTPDASGVQYRITARYFLIRAWVKLPENYYGRSLMYQVLVKRDQTQSPYTLKTLSWQEVWF